MSRKSDLGKSEILRCPYRFRCNCYVSLKIRYTKDSVIMYQAGSHTLDSHANAQRGRLTIKQRGAVKRSVRAAPLATPRIVHDSLVDLSPGKHVAYDKKSQAAVSRLVRKERKDIMLERVPEVDDDTEGSMNRLAESMSLAALIARHNDPQDPYHLDEHEPVCVGHQFADGVTFMTLTTPHLLNNMARAVNCGWQKQGHFDGAFNWCRKDFAMMWKEVQAFNTNRLVAAFVEGSDDVRRKWRDTMKKYFTCEADPPTPFTELVKRFHVAAKMPVPRTAIKGVVIPTDRYCNALSKANDGRRVTAQMIQDTGDRDFYSSLFHRTAEFNTLDEYESTDIEDKLDALEDFDRIQPMATKCCALEARCTCSDSYRKLCCVETVVFSMLFNSDLTVPSTKRGIQVKEKVKKKAMTPWSAEAEAAAKKKDKSKAPDPPSGIRVPPVPVWAPSIPTAKSLSSAPLQQVRVRFALYSSDSDWLT